MVAVTGFALMNKESNMKETFGVLVGLTLGFDDYWKLSLTLKIQELHLSSVGALVCRGWVVSSQWIH